MAPPATTPEKDVDYAERQLFDFWQLDHGQPVSSDEQWNRLRGQTRFRDFARQLVAGVKRAYR